MRKLRRLKTCLPSKANYDYAFSMLSKYEFIIKKSADLIVGAIFPDGDNNTFFLLFTDTTGCNTDLEVIQIFFFPFSESYVADFDGRSSLLYRFNQKSMSTVKDVISLRFKSHQAEGVLLHGEGQRGDYITLELHRGRLDFYLNLGNYTCVSQPFSNRTLVCLLVIFFQNHSSMRY